MDDDFYGSQARAIKCVRSIRDYWVNRGYVGIQVHAVWNPRFHNHEIVSNIGPDGFPPLE